MSEDRKCLECIDGTLESEVKDIKYLGREGVILRGCTTWTCPLCEEYEIGIPRLTELNRLVTRYPDVTCFIWKGEKWQTT